MRGVELPPGITQSRLSQPPMTSPQCLCISSFRGMLISSSTVQGLFTWPEILKSLEPELRVRPILANQSPPLLLEKACRSFLAWIAKVFAAKLFVLVIKCVIKLPADGRSNSNSLNVGDSGRATKNTNISGEWGLQAGLALLPLQALN